MVKDTDGHPVEEIHSVKSWSVPISGLFHEDGDPPNHGCVHQSRNSPEACTFVIFTEVSS